MDIISPTSATSAASGETRKLAATAETHYTLVAPHNVGGPVLTAASLQVGFTSPNFKILEHFNDFADAEDQEGGQGRAGGGPGGRVLPPVRRAPVSGSSWTSTRRPSSTAAGPVRPVGRGWEQRKPKGTEG